MAHFNPARRDRQTGQRAVRQSKEDGLYLTKEEARCAFNRSRSFISWVQTYMSTSPKSEKEAKKATLGVYRFYKFCDPTFKQPLLSLIENTHEVNEWLESLKKLSIGPSGMQRLLKQLVLYLDWALQDVVDRDKRERLEKVKSIYCRITRRLNGEKKTQSRWHREEENDFDWPSVVDRYNEAQRRAVARCRQLLHKRSSLVEDEVVLVRRSAMLAMVRANALRESAVYGLTVGEANGATWLVERGVRTLFFRVHDHKTGATSGSVEVRLEEEPAELFLLYGEYRRKCLDVKDEDKFFVQGRGKCMTTSLAIELRKLGTSLRLGVIPCPTRLRKAIQTLAPVDTQREREALAGLLHHSPAVATMYYRRQTQKDKQVSRNLLQKVLSAGNSDSTATAECPPRPSLVPYSLDSDSEDSSVEENEVMRDKAQIGDGRGEEPSRAARVETASEFDREEAPQDRLDDSLSDSFSYRPCKATGAPLLSLSAPSPKRMCPEAKLLGHRASGVFSEEAVEFLRREFSSWIEYGMPHNTKKAIEMAITKSGPLLGGRNCRSVYFKLRALEKSKEQRPCCSNDSLPVSSEA